jgi:hypothetical protein
MSGTIIEILLLRLDKDVIPSRISRGFFLLGGWQGQRGWQPAQAADLKDIQCEPMVRIDDAHIYSPIAASVLDFCQQHIGALAQRDLNNVLVGNRMATLFR